MDSHTRYWPLDYPLLRFDQAHGTARSDRTFTTVRATRLGHHRQGFARGYHTAPTGCLVGRFSSR
jgi:hypothetical protein